MNCEVCFNEQVFERDAPRSIEKDITKEQGSAAFSNIYENMGRKNGRAHGKDQSLRTTSSKKPGQSMGKLTFECDDADLAWPIQAKFFFSM